jgi:uncharacterized protein (UPF0335 family)
MKGENIIFILLLKKSLKLWAKLKTSYDFVKILKKIIKIKKLSNNQKRLSGKIRPTRLI